MKRERFALFLCFGLLALSLLLQFFALLEQSWMLAEATLYMVLAASIPACLLLWRNQRRIEHQRESDAARQESLRDSEQRWKFAIIGTNDGIWDWDIPDDTLNLSQQWKHMLGYEEHDVGSTSGEWLRLLHPDDKARVSAHLEAYLSGDASHYSQEFRMATKQGGWRWIHGRGMVVERDADGRPLRMVGTHVDIDQQKQIELSLRRHEEELAAIFNLSPDGIVSFAADGRVRDANLAFTNLLGLTQEETLKLSERDLDNLLDARGAIMAPSHLFGPRSASGEITCACGADCQSCLLYLNLPERRVLRRTRKQLAEHELSSVQHFQDVTLAIEMERSKTEFLLDAAHQLRAPLASIYGYMELMQGGEFDQETQADLLETVYKHTRQMLNMVNELLDLSQFQTIDGHEPNHERLDIGQLIGDVVAAHKTVDKSLHLNLHQAGNPGPVMGDFDALRRAFHNILDNAVKFSPTEGAIMVELHPATGEDNGNWIEVRVSDQGQGMSPGELKRLFDPFYRAHAAENLPGNGLGMTLVKSIIERHRGRIEVASMPESGTTVSVWLPTVPDTNPAVE